MISNLRAHALVGLTVGWLAAIAALNLPWMLSTRMGAIIWFAITITWELGQWALAHFRTSYLRRKWLDTILDIIVGNICFLLPWIVITLGAYSGNIMRP